MVGCHSDIDCQTGFYCTSRKQCTAYHSEYCYKNWCGIGDGGTLTSFYPYIYIYIIYIYIYIYIRLLMIGAHGCFCGLYWPTCSIWGQLVFNPDCDPNNEGDCAPGLVCGINNCHKFHEINIDTGIPSTGDCCERKFNSKCKTIAPMRADPLLITPACCPLVLCSPVWIKICHFYSIILEFISPDPKITTITSSQDTLPWKRESIGIETYARQNW